MKIYTKTGDNGETVLLNGEKVGKQSPVVEVIGCFDELNASLGLVHPIRNKKIKGIVLDLQRDLFLMGSSIVGRVEAVNYEEKTKKLEDLIDELSAQLPALKNFILPGGSKYAAHLHLSRSLARRLERRVVSIQKEHPKVKDLMKYLNRLSDLLFVMARYVNFKLGIKETIWKKEK